MRFIKLTQAHGETQTWVNIDRITEVEEYSKGSLVFVSGVDGYLLVTETPEEIISKCEAWGR